jgi:hypothetical protein
MATVAAFIGALDACRDEMRLQVLNRIAKLFGFVILASLGLCVTAANSYFLWFAWQSADATASDASNSDLIVISGLLAFMALVAEAGAISILLVRTRPTQRNQDIADALRQLIARNDDTLTPIAKLQPTPLTPTGLSVDPITVRPIRRTPSSVATTWTAIIVVIGMVLIAMFLCGFLPLIFNSGLMPTGFGDTFWFLLLPVGLPVLLLLLRFGIALSRRNSGGSAVILDDQGLHYRRERQDHLIDWSQIRSLAQIIVDPLRNITSTTSSNTAGAIGSMTYLIDSGSDLFVWSVASQARDDAFQAAETLLQHVVTRTGLPLRDATDLANEIAQFGVVNASRILLQRTRIDTRESHALTILDALKPLAPARKPSKLKIALIASAIALLAIANGILPLAGFRLWRAMSEYQANFVSNMRARGQIYAIDFATNDGEWPEARASTDDYRNYVFTGGAYHLSGTKADMFIDAWPTESWLADGAVEATVSQLDQSPVVPHADQTGGAGVIFHASSNSDRLIMFVVNTDGHWRLDYYVYVDDHSSDNWHYLDEGYSPAVHKGLGAQNTILYIQHDRHITVYVNGQQVTSDTYSADYYSDLPMDGLAGIYSDQSAMDMAFTHFADYALPPPPDFWANVGLP